MKISFAYFLIFLFKYAEFCLSLVILLFNHEALKTGV